MKTRSQTRGKTFGKRNHNKSERNDERGGEKKRRNEKDAKKDDKKEVYIVATSEDLSDVRCFFDGQKVLALDCEGVRLSRHGRLSLVQLGTLDGKKILFDVLEKKEEDDIVMFIRSILENASIKLVIHDASMDNDALVHHLNVKMNNVHDTSCWEEVQGWPHSSLNAALERYNIPSNVHREKNIYKSQPNFWAKRPLSKKMTQWASGDISSLLELYQQQIQKIKGKNQKKAVKKLIEANLQWSNAKTNFIDIAQPRRFFGKGGSNIRRLQKLSNTTVYSAPHEVARNKRGSSCLVMCFYFPGKSNIKVFDAYKF
mmetsp:Transcript_5864/g.8683  ORF Transcript_5864/g.8683 Transcript_5864/m.8683 type:complete len:314 (-) Transcript_5864:61-1002(-)